MKDIDKSSPPLRLVFWELTAACNLHCQHCRAEAQEEAVANELTTDQILEIAEDIRKEHDPIIILTGGEPLIRPDFETIASKCTELFSRVAVASNGTTIDRAWAEKLKNIGIARVSVSLDGAAAETHDSFRGIPGSFKKAKLGCKEITDAGLSLQINTTLTKRNAAELKDILKLSTQLGADAFHVFVLVPVGCGAEIEEGERITPDEMEEILSWLHGKFIENMGKIHIKATCAPQYYRIIQEHKKNICYSPPKDKSGHPHGMQAMSKGCLAGSSVCFISRIGDVQPCGYLPIKAGNIQEIDFSEIWNNSDLFQSLRDPKGIKGKCGHCRYLTICQGCRARAFAEYGDCLEEDPDCIYGRKS